jgi:hypothetical protein
VFKDEPNRASSLFAVQHSLEGSAWTGILPGPRNARARQKGERGTEQDEEAAQAQLDMTQRMLPRPNGASPLR